MESSEKESLDNLKKKHKTRIIEHAYKIVLQRQPKQDEIDSWLSTFENGCDAVELIRQLRAKKLKAEKKVRTPNHELSQHAQKILRRLTFNQGV